MGKHWNRRGREARERGMRRCAGKPRVRAKSIHAAAPALGSATSPESARRAERRLESGCASKRTYRTLQQAADAKYRYDREYGDPSHVYRCRLICGMYHPKSEGGDGSVADRFLPAPSDRALRPRPAPFGERLAAAMEAAGLDAAALAAEVGAEEGEVAGWLAGDARGAFRAPELARALGVGVRDLI